MGRVADAGKSGVIYIMVTRRSYGWIDTKIIPFLIALTAWTGMNYSGPELVGRDASASEMG